MTDRLEIWQHGAEKWLRALEMALNGQDEDDVAVPYTQVAFAFPSSEPNPRSFDKPLLDHAKLGSWASEAGWRVQPAPEMAARDSNDFPPVRFTKQISN